MKTYASPVAGSVPFDPSATDLAAENLQAAIEELDGGKFSYRRILAGKTVRIPDEQQMIVSQEVAVDDTAELHIQGEMVVIL